MCGSLRDCAGKMSMLRQTLRESVHEGQSAASRLRHRYGREMSRILRGALAGEVPKIAHHVHLIVVADGVRNICPRPFRRRQLLQERSVEANNPRIEPGCHPDAPVKSALELSDTQPGDRCPLWNVKCTPIKKNPVCYQSNRIRRCIGHTAIDQEFGNSANPLIERHFVCQRMLQGSHQMSKDRLGVKGLIGQFFHRDTEQLMEARRLKMNGRTMLRFISESYPHARKRSNENSQIVTTISLHLAIANIAPLLSAIKLSQIRQMRLPTTQHEVLISTCRWPAENQIGQAQRGAEALPERRDRRSLSLPAH
jgi:hypothetical protein